MVALGLAVVLVPVGLLSFPWVMQRKTDGKSPILTSLKRLAMATLIYTGDNDDRLPPDMRDARSAMQSIVADPKQLKRSDPDVIYYYTPDRHVFDANSRIQGKKVSMIDDPASTLLYFQMFEKPDGHLSAVFVDSHAKTFPTGKVLLAASTSGVIEH